jgi:hypothetical protein
MREIVADQNLIAACGLYCGACKKYLRGSCPGCAANQNATWCSVRSCCGQRGYKSCADCTEFSNLKDCKKYNNWIARAFGLIFRSNRAACIALIREQGYPVFAADMTANKRQSLPR